MEENSYFKVVVKEAIEDLDKNGIAYLFYAEQVEELKKARNDINISLEDGVYIVTKG